MSEFSRNIILANTFDDFSKQTEIINFDEEDLVCYDISNITVFYFLNLESVWFHLNWEWYSKDDYGYFKSPNTDYSIIPIIPDGYRLRRITDMFKNLSNDITLLGSNWVNLKEIDLSSTKNINKFVADFSGSEPTIAQFWCSANETYIKKLDLSNCNCLNIFKGVQGVTSTKYFIIDDDNKGFNIRSSILSDYPNYTCVCWKGSGAFKTDYLVDASVEDNVISIACISDNSEYDLRVNQSDAYKLLLNDNDKISNSNIDDCVPIKVNLRLGEFDRLDRLKLQISDTTMFAHYNSELSDFLLDLTLEGSTLPKRYSYKSHYYFKDNNPIITKEDLANVEDCGLTCCTFRLDKEQGSIDITEFDRMAPLGITRYVHLPNNPSINFGTGYKFKSENSNYKYTVNSYSLPVKIKHKEIMNSLILGKPVMVESEITPIFKWELGNIEVLEGASNTGDLALIEHNVHITDDSIIKAKDLTCNAIYIDDASKPHLYISNRYNVSATTLNFIGIYYNLNKYPLLEDANVENPTESYNIYTIEWVDDENYTNASRNTNSFSNVNALQVPSNVNQIKVPSTFVTSMSKGVVLNRGYKYDDTDVDWLYVNNYVNEWGYIKNSSIYFVCPLREDTIDSFYQAVMKGPDITAHTQEFNMPKESYDLFTEEQKTGILNKGYDLVYRI